MKTSGIINKYVIACTVLISAVIWSERCREDQKESEHAPTFDELTGDSTTVLQGWVEDSATRCAVKLVDSFLGNAE